MTDTIVIREEELEESFVHASGPGGQNVNKVATAVQLRFDLRHSASLPPAVKERLARIAGRRMTRDGILVIDARRHRTQERNRQDARERLAALVRQAATAPRRRVPTRPTRASEARRVAAKQQRAHTKRLRGKVAAED